MNPMSKGIKPISDKLRINNLCTFIYVIKTNTNGLTKEYFLLTNKQL